MGRGGGSDGLYQLGLGMHGSHGASEGWGQVLVNGEEMRCGTMAAAVAGGEQR